eukprot:scaffold84626_cov22-Tisochrysis_lutea.AAC.4
MLDSTVGHTIRNLARPQELWKLWELHYFWLGINNCRSYCIYGNCRNLEEFWHSLKKCAVSLSECVCNEVRQPSIHG